MASHHPFGEITRLLAALREGNSTAESQLIDLVYSEFHSRAQHHMRRERPDHTLQPIRLDARQIKVVEMLYFDGLSEEEAAALLGVGVRTVKRDRIIARAWLYSELTKSAE